MPSNTLCPRCGAVRPSDSPDDLCPECLLRLAWTSDLSAGPGEASKPGGRPGPARTLSVPGGRTRDRGVLETLTEAVGPAPRVLLRDTEPINGPGPVVRPTSPEMPDPSERAGRLQLLGEIARGGMGAILKGRDNDLGRDLAVKVLLERHGDNPELLRRFVEEAQIAGQLQHPGVVPVYELGTFADRRPYFAMKLVKGRTLSALLDARRDPSDDRPRFLAIFEQVCQTMAYAHARGVIHRDLKPSNVMVGAFGEVQVMDWGLAKVLVAGGVADDERSIRRSDESVIQTVRSGSDADASLAGSVLGTPAYMAPEQARGEIDSLDERVDVFGLGAILCEILTGQPPSRRPKSSGEVLRLAGRCRPGRRPGATTRDASGADAELQALVRRCLAAEPRHRPREAGEVALAIRHHLDGVQDRLRRAELARVEAEAAGPSRRPRSGEWSPTSLPERPRPMRGPRRSGSGGG